MAACYPEEVNQFVATLTEHMKRKVIGRGERSKDGLEAKGFASVESLEAERKKWKDSVRFQGRQEGVTRQC